MKTTPHEYFSEDQQGIVYQEHAEPLISVVIAFFSFFFLVLTAASLDEVLDWPWHGGKVAGLLTLLAFAGFGAVTGLLAFAGLQPQHLRFDAATRRVQGRARGRLWLLLSIDTDFAPLQKPVINTIAREMDSDLYEVHVEWAGHLSLALGSYEKRSDAEFWRARLDRLLKT